MISPEAALIYQDLTAMVRRECEEIGMPIMRGKNIPTIWKPGQGWSLSYKPPDLMEPDFFQMDEKDLQEKSPDYCKGVALHEWLHAWMSRPGYLNDIWRETGCAVGFNWFEDNRIEYNADEAYYEGRQLIKKHLDVDIAPDGGLDYKGIQKKIKDKMGYVPKHIMFGGMGRNFFYKSVLEGSIKNEADEAKFINEEVPEELRETFTKLKESIKKFYSTTPQLYSNDEEIEAKAKESCDVFRDEIWPEYQKLVEKSVEDQSFDEFFKDIVDQMQGKDGAVVFIPIDQLPPDLQQEIKEKIDEMQKEAQGQQPGGGQGQPQPGEGTQGQSQPGKGQGTPKEGDESGQGDVSDKESQKDHQKVMDKLSDEAKEKAKEAFDKLNPSQKEKIKDKAKETIGDVEDEVNDQIRGQNNSKNSSKETKLGPKKQKQDQQSQKGEGAGEEGEEGKEGEPEDEGGKKEKKPSGKKKEEDKEGEKAEGQDQSQEKIKPDDKEEQKMRKEMEKYFNDIEKRTQNKSTYDKTRNLPEVKEAIDRLVDKFYDIFHPTDKPRHVLSNAGDDVDMDQAMATEYDQTIDDPFIEESKPEVKSYRFTLLLDLSDSMSDKIGEMYKMVVIMSETLTKLGIEFEVQGFTDFQEGPVRIYRSYEETEKTDEMMTDEQKANLTRILKEGGGSTPTSRAIATSISRIYDLEQSDSDKKRDHNFLILFSDGSPNEGTEQAAKNIAGYKEDAVNFDLNLRMIGLGIGPGTEFMDDLLPLLPDDLREQIAKELTGVGKRRMITQGIKNIKNYKAEDVGNSYEDVAQLSSVIDLILEYMIEYPEEF